MNRSEVIKYKDNLLNNLRLLGEYDIVAGLRRTVLLVEGATDQKFVRHVINDDTRCIAVADFMKARSAFSTSQSSPPVQYNSKEVIITILNHIAWFPDCFDFPKGAEQWPLYGLVDNDFGDSKLYTRVTKLFFTDTHDIETMMIATDGDLLTRLKQCRITVDEVKAALYIADQMAAFRQAIKDNGSLNPSLINSKDGTIDYGKFSENNKVSLVKLLEYINSKSENALPKEKLKKTQDAIIKHMKNQLDKEGLWKNTLESFEVRGDSEFWMMVNGHDFLSAICYKNPSARKVFSNNGGYTYNRDFELALSEVYDYNCFKKTKLYAKFQAAGLLRE